jgi:ElaB/YqjD/DUF883 family membrane-anchored ribosome-binding protein
MAKDTVESLKPIERAKEAVSEGLDTAREKFQEVADDMGKRYKKVSDDVRRGAAKASDVARQRYEDAAETMRTGYVKVRKDVNDLTQNVNEYVKDNPGKSVLIAAGAGFLLGLLFRRGRRDD